MIQAILSDRSKLPVDGSLVPPEFQRAPLNFIFRHFLSFVLEFELVSKSDMEPLMQLVQRFTARKQQAKETIEQQGDEQSRPAQQQMHQ